MPDKRVLRTAEAAAYCGSTKSSFEKMRISGKGASKVRGPRFIRVGRIVLYPIEELDAFLDQQRRFGSTSEPKAPRGKAGQPSAAA